MKSMVQHIEYLLTRHDCVVVPGWGAWIVQSVSAVVAGNAAPLPPRRWLSFNASLSHNDGMLAHSLMRAEGCGYDEAMAQIAAEVSSWRVALQGGRCVELGNIGSFSTEEGLLLFKESPRSVVNASLAMLPPVALTPLAELPQEEADDVPSGWQPVQEPSLARRVFAAVASVAAIVVLLLFISTPIDNYPTQNDYASIVATELFAASSQTQAVTAEAAPVPESGVETPAVAVAVADELPAKREPAPEVAMDVVPRYILVVGSLPSYALAEKQIGQFRASGVTDPLYIYDNGGKSRLYIAGYATLAEAQQHLEAVQRDAASPYEGVWICRTR